MNTGVLHIWNMTSSYCGVAASQCVNVTGCAAQARWSAVPVTIDTLPQLHINVSCRVGMGLLTDNFAILSDIGLLQDKLF